MNRDHNWPRQGRNGAESMYITRPKQGRNPLTPCVKSSTFRRFDRQVVLLPLLFAFDLGEQTSFIHRFLDTIFNPKLAIPAGLLLLLTLTAWGWLIRFRLKGRRLVYLVPTESFDPAPEDVFKFAASLSRTPALAAPRRAAAVRIVLSHSGDGGMAYGVEHPAGREAVVATAGYAKATAVEPDPTTGDVPESAAI